MSDTYFDAYHQWLRIPPAEQPPDHYRLLGLPRFEQNASVIQTAADGAMTHVRSFQGGPQGDQTQWLLNQLAIAKLVLIDSARKSAYDAVLRSAQPAERLELQQEAFATTPAAALMSDTHQALPQTQYGQYQVLERSAASSMWMTFKVRHAETGRLFSLKTLPAAAAKNMEVVKRFRREIEIVTKLNHENLISGVDFGEAGSVPFLVTEYVLGTDLETIVKQQGPLPVETALDYTAQAARALHQLHENGVYHRNLKPQVLLVDLQGRVKVTNLLLAKIERGSEMAPEESLTRQGTLMGSVDYLAPEQAMDAKSVDARTDIYSLGCVLHFLLTGQPPYTGKSIIDKLKSHRQGAIPNLATLRADVPDNVQSVFARMVAKELTQRFATMAEVEQALAPRSKALQALGNMNLWIIAGGMIAAVVVLGVALGIMLSR